MFWNKKGDKRSLPDLPPLQDPPVIGRKVGLSEKNELPSFPDSAHEKGFSQAAIKDAVGTKENLADNENARFPEPSEFRGRRGGEKKSIEMEEWSPSMKEINEEEEEVEELGLPEPNIGGVNKRFSGVEDKNRDIFVKLNKFYSARKALMDAQEKLGDVDELLRRIRETKMREDQELSGWERELSQVKARLNDVTLNLFEKVD